MLNWGEVKRRFSALSFAILHNWQDGILLRDAVRSDGLKIYTMKINMINEDQRRLKLQGVAAQAEAVPLTFDWIRCIKAECHREQGDDEEFLPWSRSQNRRSCSGSRRIRVSSVSSVSPCQGQNMYHMNLQCL